MRHQFSRRKFLGSVAATAAALPFWPRLSSAAVLNEMGHVQVPVGSLPIAPITLAVSPFDLHDVRLLPGLQQSAQEVNRKFLMGLSTDRLLHVFRVNAGLPSAAEPYGGWEAPVNELRGHFVGHYMSACALMAAHTGDAAIKARGDEIVSGLEPVQQALGDGYLSAFPTELFDRLKNRQRVWAPFYTYHKILAGLLDTHTLGGNARALEMAKRMANWAKAYAAPISDEQWQQMLNVEHGGMADTLRELSQVTGDTSYADLARRFDHEKFLQPLAASRDELKGVHANTNIPKVLGAARLYEMTGEQRPRVIADYFWDEITDKRAYATGGTSNDEEWQGEPGQLSKALGGMTQETCCTYNMLKLTRHKFTWAPDSRIADYYERAYYNGILPTQHPSDGEKAYYTPLADGYWKLFGTPEKGFWCCHGTGAENFSKLGDSVYFHDDSGIYVNLFVPSEVRWKAKSLTLAQHTRFPETDTTTLTVTVPKATAAAIRVRIPYWANKGVTAKLNGVPTKVVAASNGYFAVERVWHTGDVLEVKMPMQLHMHAMPDDATVQALMYGPLVMVAKMGTGGITNLNRRAVPTPPREVPQFVRANVRSAPAIDAPSDDPSSWLRPVKNATLTFETVGQTYLTTFVPLYSLFDERYATYLKVNRT